MKFLVLILSVVLTYASCDAFGDLLGQESQLLTIDHVRAKRQHQLQRQNQPAQAQPNYRPYSQAPSQIKQLLQAQQAREPIVHLPPQPPPRLGPAQPSQGQHRSQAQAAQYQPQVQYGSAPQQPTYKSIPVAPAQYRKPVGPQQPQYRPAAGHYPQQAAQSNYQGQGAQQPQYSSKLPPQLQQLLQLQANLPNTIPTGHAAPQSRNY